MKEFLVKGTAIVSWQMKIPATTKAKAEKEALEELSRIIEKPGDAKIKSSEEIKPPEEKSIKKLNKAEARKKIAVVKNKGK